MILEYRSRAQFASGIKEMDVCWLSLGEKGLSCLFSMVRQSGLAYKCTTTDCRCILNPSHSNYDNIWFCTCILDSDSFHHRTEETRRRFLTARAPVPELTFVRAPIVAKFYLGILICISNCENLELSTEAFEQKQAALMLCPSALPP